MIRGIKGKGNRLERDQGAEEYVGKGGRDSFQEKVPFQLNSGGRGRASHAHLGKHILGGGTQMPRP